MSQFDYQRLDAYQKSVDFIVLADLVIRHLPRGHSHIADQLRRAATSIALNIAEGAGEFSPTDKARFYRIARRSATECAAILDICDRLELASAGHTVSGHEMLRQIISMLVALIRTCEGRGKGKGFRNRDLPLI